MSKKKRKTLPFAEIDHIRKTMGWHIEQIMELFKQLGTPKEPRGMIGGCNELKTTVFLLFKGTPDDIFLVKEFLEKMDNEE